MTIIALAAAALGAVMAFRKTPEGQAAAEGETTLTRIRRSTSVVLALAEALWTVLDALTMLTGRRVTPVTVGTNGARSGSTTLRTPNFGSQTASDVVVAD